MWVTRERCCGDGRTPRVGEAKHARHLIERFADRVIKRFPEQLVVTVTFEEDELRM